MQNLQRRINNILLMIFSVICNVFEPHGSRRQPGTLTPHAAGIRRRNRGHLGGGDGRTENRPQAAARGLPLRLVGAPRRGADGGPPALAAAPAT